MDKITEIRIEEVKDYENNEFTISLETNYNNWGGMIEHEDIKDLNIK